MIATLRVTFKLRFPLTLPITILYIFVYLHFLQMQSVKWYYKIYIDSHTESLCQVLDKFLCQFINMKYCIFFPLFANFSVTNIWPRVSTHDPDRLYKSQLIQIVDKEYVATCYRNPSLVVCMMTRGTNDPFVVEGGPVKVNRSFPS